MKNKHPYEFRKWLGENLPWFLINLGIADKGKDCNLVQANHKWYNNDNETSGCYYCKVISKGQKMENLIIIYFCHSALDAESIIINKFQLIRFPPSRE